MDGGTMEVWQALSLNVSGWCAGGIYRHVWLNMANTLHIAPWGVWTNATVVGKITSMSSDAIVNSETTVVNSAGQEAHFKITQTIRDANNKAVATASSPIYTLGARANATYLLPVPVTEVALWSDRRPTLYIMTSEIVSTDTTTTLDSVQTRFGFRQLIWDPEKGLILNGLPTKIRGLANHQDFAGVGVAVPGIHSKSGLGLGVGVGVLGIYSNNSDSWC